MQRRRRSLRTEFEQLCFLCRASFDKDTPTATLALRLALELMNFNANIFNPVELKLAMQELNFEHLIHARDALMFSIYPADSAGKRKGSFDV